MYLHIYIHFKISECNEFIEFKEDINKQTILSSIYYKLPFVFDGTDIIKPFKKEKDKNDKNDKKEKDKNKNKNIHIKPYEPISLLEPSVRFFTKDTIYELKKGKSIDIHRNLHCRNFYMVHSGKVTIYCIHPKFKLDISNIEINTDILRVELHPNSILFVPNYWQVYIKSHEKSVIEKVQYKTILNEVNFLYDKYNARIK
jgi:mannose-6-phosphate isomerase-like protein (cupin superfamily)